MSPDQGETPNGTSAESDILAATDVLPQVYTQLRNMADRLMAKEPEGHTLQATALVHEAFLRVLGGDQDQWNSPGHFFCAAAEAMRRILVERARRVATLKRGGDRERAQIDIDELVEEDEPGIDILGLHEALVAFEAHDQTRSEVVKLRFFAGLTIDQSAAVLGISPATANRHWVFARAWLCEHMLASE